MTDSGVNRAPLRGSVRLLVVGVVLLTALLTAAVAIGLQYYFSRAMAIDAAVAGYQQTARHTGEFIQAIDRRATQVTRLLARYPQLALPAIPAAGDEQQLLALFAQAMRNNPIYFSIYLGLPNGDFLEVVNLESSPDMRELLKAQPDERWLVNRVRNHQGQRIRQLDYFAADMAWRRQRQEPSNYDVRQRRWYSDARVGEVNKTQPYIFNYPQVPGQTYSLRLPDSQVVLGIDITLQTLSDYLRQQPLGSTGDLYLYKASGEILASNRLGHSRAGELAVTPMALTPSEQAYIRQLGSIKVSNQLDWPPIDFAVAGQPRGYGVELLQLAAARLGLELNFINGYSWAEILANFARGELDMIQPVTDSPANRARGYLSQPVMRLPLALALRSQQGEQPASLSLAQLGGKTLAIPQGWSSIEAIRRAYPDISILEVASPRAALEAVRDGRAYATLDSSAVLHYTANQYFMDGLSFIETLDTGAAALPTEFRLLLRPELQALGKLLERAIAGLDSTQVAQLQHKWLLAGANPGERFISVPYKPLLDAVQQPQQQYTPLQLQLAGQPHLAYVEPLNPDDANSDYFAVVVPAAQVLGESLKRVSLSLLFTGACLLLVLPLAWLLAEGIVRPVRQLYDKSIKVKERRYGEVTYSPSRVREIDELLQSMVAMAQSIQHYEQEQRRLMDAFIELIAEAIDEKSPYTGGHCERVPTLALMLAEKAAAAREGPLADFGFATEEAEREFRIAAWLHDCGKITVPEHIVDKGTKLETIYNRIHEIRMRFEVLWRDAEIAYLRALAQQPADAERLRLELERQRRQLQADFAFIAATNVGGEFLSDEAKQRLRELGAITWVRYFDDRLGLSPVEELRLQHTQVRPLPASEPLLADRPEHLIKRQRPLNYDPAWGIQVQPPEYLYNLGEIYNLSIARGTLTAEDRFKINEHIISTIRMLEKLPFPDELKRVPRYASTHHETMKGTGYPRQLRGDQLSVPERIMVVADIFEALTAADRPYKKAKTLSESLAIMHKMVQEQHIDGDIFELFLTSGVYRDYAQRYLGQAQIDEVDIHRYLRQPVPAQEKD